MSFAHDPNYVLRDFDTDGIPASGRHEPRKPDLRAMLSERDQTLIALVAEQEGLELPNLLIRYSITGGTANAIVAEANLPVPDGVGLALFSIIIEEENTGAVTINGKPLKLRSGDDLPSGYLTPGPLLFMDAGDQFHVLSYGDAEAAQAAAEAALADLLDRYLGAHVDDAAATAAAGTPVEGQLYWNTTDDLLKVWNGVGWVAATQAASTIYENTFDGDGVEDTFTLTSDTAAVLLVSVGTLVQTPGVDYTVTGDQLAFTSPPPDTTKIVAIQVETVPLGTTTASLVTLSGGGNVQDALDSVGNVVADRTELAALDASTAKAATLTERGREGIFVPVLASSLSSDEQTIAAADDAAGQGRYVADGAYFWIRKFAKPRSVQRYGMHPDATASENVTALQRALAAEPYLVIDAEVGSDGLPRPYLIDAGVTSVREGQIIEGEGFNSVIKANAAIAGAMIETTTERYQQIRSLKLDGNSNAAYGVKLNFPKCDLRDSMVIGCSTAGVWMGYFSQFVGDGCYILNNQVGILIQDATGQVNDMRIGGGRRGSISGNNSHGMIFASSNRDGFWVEGWNMENNGALADSSYADVAVNANLSGLHFRDMYHETDHDNANWLFYRLYSSSQGVSFRNIKMSAGSPSTKPNYLMYFAYSGGTISEGYTLDDIWGRGYQTAFIQNSTSAGGVNEIRYGTIMNPQGGTLFSSTNAVSRW